MRIGCLQFAPVKGDVNNNLSRADAVLLKENADDLESLDLLVLPELAFSGYYFKSLQEIFPHLEPTGSGISSLWARTVALKYGCTVVVGYPEKVDISDKWPASPEYYNSAIIVNQDGETSGGYRKSHLYSVDETWALEGHDGFFCGEIAGVDNAVLGISMDIAPYKFQTPWITYDFAFHILNVQSNLVIVTLAWPTSQDHHLFSRSPSEPDIESLMTWMPRLGPLIHAESEEEIIVVFANRCGSEDGMVYAGTSAVLGICDGEVNVYGILGRAEKEILIVDTDKEPYGKLVYRPERVNDATEKTFYNKDKQDESKTSETIPPPLAPPPPRKGIATGEGVESEPHQAGESSLNKSPGNATEKPPHKRGRDTPKLSIDTGREVTGSLPNIPTPTAPSPTPISRRPRLSIPPAESWTQRYLNQHHYMPSPPYPGITTPSIPARILGGEVVIAQSAGSVENEQESHFDWDIQQVLTPSSTRVEYSPTQTESTYFSELSSVHTGRGGAAGGSHQRAEPSRGLGGAARSSMLDKVQEMQEILPKPRTMEQLATDYAKLQMEEMKKGQLSATRGFPQPNQRPCSSKGTEQSKRDRRAGQEGQGFTSHERVPSSQDAGSKGPQNRGSNEQKPPRGKADADNPRARAESQGEPERGRGPSSVGATNSPRPRVPRASSTDKSREESRGRSRRTRPDAPGPSAASGTPDDQKQSKREGSGRRSAKAAQQIDLSQFRMIEEYPSEDCPIHSSRSRDRAGSHDQNNAKPPSKPTPRHRSVSARGQRNNMRMPNVKSNVQKAPPGVRKQNGPTQTRNHSDINSHPDDETRPHSALETRQHFPDVLGTFDMREAIPRPRSGNTKHFYPPWEGDRKTWVDERLNTLSKSVPPVSPAPDRRAGSQVSKKEPQTPQAMLIVYDPVEGDNDNVSLAGQTLQCVAKTPAMAKKTLSINYS